HNMTPHHPHTAALQVIPPSEGCERTSVLRRFAEMRNRARLISVACVALAATAVATVSANARPSAVTTHATAKPYFVGNFDTCDFSQWNLQGPTAAFRISRSPRTEGRCAAVVSVGSAALG